MKHKLPDEPFPALGATVEITHQHIPMRGRVVGRSFDQPARLDLDLGKRVVARNIPVNRSLRVIES